MNALGFSKNEREINRHHIHLYAVLENSFGTNTSRLAGSTSEGICGGIYNDQNYHDYDLLFTTRKIKLYTPRTNTINNPPLLPLHDNEDYDASFYVEEDDNFPGYVKLSLAEMKTNCVYLDHCRKMNDDKLYLANSVIIDSQYELFVKSSSSKEEYIPFHSNKVLGPYRKGEKTGPAFEIHQKVRVNTANTDIVQYIHYDSWPTSANSFIMRRKPNNWPSNRMLENIKSQGCDVVLIGQHDSNNNDIQRRISFPGEQNLLLDLSDVQILCYVLITIVLRKNLNTSQREVVSSFHIKHVVFGVWSFVHVNG